MARIFARIDVANRAMIGAEIEPRTFPGCDDIIEGHIPSHRMMRLRTFSAEHCNAHDVGCKVFDRAKLAARCS